MFILHFSTIDSTTRLLPRLQCRTSSSAKITDEHHNTDTKYKQRLTLEILNGKFQHQTTTINHTYVASQADTEAFSKNNKVLLHITDSLKAQLLSKNVIP